MADTQISSRRDMFSLFQSRLENTQSDLVENQELEFGRNMLKTYIIESNISPSEFIESHEPIQLAQEIDTDLYLLSIKGSYGEGHFFLDVEDDRFWVFYSTDKSSLTKPAIKDMLSSEGSGLDHPWIPGREVERIVKMGEFQGLGVKYDAEEVFPEDFIEENLMFGDLSLRTSGHGTKDLFDILQSSDEINKFISLSNVQIRREVENEFIRERITNWGSFTTRGGSDVQLHVDTVQQIKERYSNLLSAIEENHLLSSVQSQQHGAQVDGKPLLIKLSKRIDNVEQFINHIVNSQDPLRLWGTKSKLGQDYFKVRGADMHNGDKFTMEVSPTQIRLYLYEGACGNTALRIFTNLQQHYDPAAQMTIQDV